MESKQHKPIIGITLGDYNGIGPEVILKTINDGEILKFFTPVIYASTSLLKKYRKLCIMSEDIGFVSINEIGDAQQKKINILDCWTEDYNLEPGLVTETAGKCAFLSLQKCTEDLKNGFIDAMVTAPINKKNIQNVDFNFVGHTEYLQSAFAAPEVLMFMVSENLKIAVVSMHVPLQDVRKDITKEKIEARLQIMLQSLKKDFGITKPKIAILGLNPHAGDAGLIGKEDIEIIKPLIEEHKNKGNLVFGPYPADGFFAAKTYTSFDAVLAMYHDQGLIPFKMLAFEDGVNYTAGLKAIRTSPDHGTAYDIAGKNLANEHSFRAAVYTAIDILKNKTNTVS